MDKNETWRTHTLVKMQITGSQKTLMLVSIRLETQADTLSHVLQCFSQHVETGVNSAKRAGSHRVRVTKYIEFISIVFTRKLLLVL
jgi:hypothetical protein